MSNTKDHQFVFACCQRGAEAALKREVAVNWPDLRFAYSRPGFVTFKNFGKPLSQRFDLKSIFARTYGFSMGKAVGNSVDECISGLFPQISGTQFDHLHVWKRDRTAPTQTQYQPGSAEDTSDLANKVLAEIQNSTVEKTKAVVHAESANQPAAKNQSILDVIILEDNDWWIGSHKATSYLLRQPGGLFPVHAPEKIVSRAYLKMAEALAWSRLPIKPGDRWVEIGSAPGGACQALLERKMQVTGIDPSKMDESIFTHPNFTHIQKRGIDLKRAEYSGFRWLAIDTNVAPNHTLDTLEAIATHPKSKLEGMIITLKLLDWILAEQIRDYANRIRSWGYSEVRCRQLSYNRQEICVAALKNRALKRLTKKKTSRKSETA